MKQFEYQIIDPLGIHARPAGQLAKISHNYNCIIKIDNGKKQVELTRPMNIMGMGIKQGDIVTISADGANEGDALKEIYQFFCKNL